MRISLFGGSGVGKSTICAYLFSELKCRGFNVEQCCEWIKTWAYMGRKKQGFDEVYVFAKQLHREDVLLQSGVEHLVTDSPVLLQTFYSDLVKHPTVEGQMQMARAFEAVYPSMNILLGREGVPFSPIGRYEKSVEEAMFLDRKIEAFLQKEGVQYIRLPAMDRPLLLNTVLQTLEQKPKPKSAYQQWMQGAL